MLMGNKRLQAHSGERLRVLASRWWQASRAGAGDLWSGIMLLVFGTDARAKGHEMSHWGQALL